MTDLAKTSNDGPLHGFGLLAGFVLCGVALAAQGFLLHAIITKGK